MARALLVECPGAFYRGITGLDILAISLPSIIVCLCEGI